jgi:hypothetical protein
MRPPSTSEELLHGLPEGAPERTLYQSLYEVVHALGLEHSERQGMATVAALEQSEVVFDDGRVLGAGPLEVGIEDICRVVAVELNDVEPDPIVWKSRYPMFLEDSSLSEESARIGKRIAQLKFVREVR